jgi:O-methyltransferase
MKIFTAINRRINKLKSIAFFKSLHKKYAEYSMVLPNDYVDCLKLVDAYKNVNGCVVECGVWRGGMIAAIAEVFGTEREYFLFDSFEGLPPAKEIDGKTALDWQANTEGKNYHDNCAASIEWSQKAMQIANAKNVHFVKGWFQDTVPNFKCTTPIAILRLDGDWYESTMVCLENLFNKVQVGGLIILDDYYSWDGCSKALHDYLSKNKRSEKIFKAYSGGCFLVKQD